MKQLIYIATTVVILTGCMGNDATFRQREWYKQFENKPLTIKEKDYIKQLEKKGYFKVDIQPPTIGVDATNMSIYSIKLHSNIQYTNKNVDSIKNIHYEFAKELFKGIIEDSILFEIHDISVKLTLNRNNHNYSFYNYYIKKQLEQDLGFKVIKEKNGKYKRVKL